MLVVTAVIVLLTGWLGWRRLMTMFDRENKADWGSKWINRLDGLMRIFCRRFHRLQFDPIRLPESGGVLVASNHISGLDPLLLIAASERPLRFLMAREYYEIHGLKWLFRAVGCIPVERSSRPQAALYAARVALEAGEAVAIFPHGTIHLDHESPRKLKRGVAWLARFTGASIYPTRIEGVTGLDQGLLSVWRRSHARITCYPEIDVTDQSEQSILTELGHYVSPDKASTPE